ncbi:hypothetical protein M378DRAFT_163011 [Amanita muscaria Koide BX008]|uniref:Protein kinase domain-containing protein n=1 Tax=Amanita muscaria (strain Koide BX008) TaxID=946122 RepID=A0A0C2WSC1_AMAMK|nr:hypothetical protein M378DRAFT_163011 [Amanita muscaria Koide BX008]
MFGYRFNESDVYVDSDNHVKLQSPGFCPDNLSKVQFDYGYYDNFTCTSDDSVHEFGVLFYEVVFNTTIAHPEVVTRRPIWPIIPDNVWQLIQRCCAKDPKERPTMVQVVQEMQSWISLGQFIA